MFHPPRGVPQLSGEGTVSARRGPGLAPGCLPGPCHQILCERVALRGPPVDHPTVADVGYHPQHAQRAWHDVVNLLAECLPVTGAMIGSSDPTPAHTGQPMGVASPGRPVVSVGRPRLPGIRSRTRPSRTPKQSNSRTRARAAAEVTLQSARCGGPRSSACVIMWAASAGPERLSSPRPPRLNGADTPGIYADSPPAWRRRPSSTGCLRWPSPPGELPRSPPRGAPAPA